MESNERKTPGIVLSAAYFPHSETEQHPLDVILQDSGIRSGVSGIWVPDHLRSHHETMDDLIKIANGTSLRRYDFTARHPYEDEHYDTYERVDEHEEIEPIPLIIDTCVSGAAPVQRIDSILERYQAKRNILTVTIGIGKAGLKDIMRAYEGEESIEFYMVATYPEDHPDDAIDLALAQINP